jgi:hypothetical protein
MRISDRTYILILLALVIGLSYASYGQFRRFNQSLGEVKLPEIEIPETKLEEFFTSQGEGKQEWISPDGKLKLAYPAGWTEIDKTFLEYLGQTGMTSEEVELLFSAHRLQVPALLLINKTKEQRSINEIIEEIKQNIEEQNGKIEINIIEQDNEIGWLEMIIEYPGQQSSYSKGKAIISGNETYLIILSSYEADWPKFEQEAQEIFDSAQLVL